MIDGKLVRLRAFEDGDLDANHAFANDLETQQLMQSGIPFPSSMSDERQWLERQTSYTRGEYQFAVEDFEGYLVGRCGLIKVDWKNRLGEAAIMIGAPYRGRGYGREAMGLLCGFCFREMNLHKIKVRVLACNEPALNCYRSNGFVQEGILRSEIWRNGAWHDVILLSRWAEE